MELTHLSHHNLLNAQLCAKCCPKPWEKQSSYKKVGSYWGRRQHAARTLHWLAVIGVEGKISPDMEVESYEG